MGLKLFSDHDEPLPSAVEKGAPQPPMPDPRKFQVREVEEINGWTVVRVHYPACTTYQGQKLLVYAVPPGVVLRQTRLDPHFLERDDQLSPVARFEPTARGRKLARALCRVRKGI